MGISTFTSKEFVIFWYFFAGYLFDWPCYSGAVGCDRQLLLFIQIDLSRCGLRQDLTKEPNPLPSMDGDMRHILGLLGPWRSVHLWDEGHDPLMGIFWRQICFGSVPTISNPPGGWWISRGYTGLNGYMSYCPVMDHVSGISAPSGKGLGTPPWMGMAGHLEFWEGFKWFCFHTKRVPSSKLT